MRPTRIRAHGEALVSKDSNSPSRQLLNQLSFVLLPPDGEPNFWTVLPSDDETADELRGRQYGSQFTEAILSGLGTLTLSEIIQAMPRPLGSLEHGFLSTVALAIGVGPDIARAAVRYATDKQKVELADGEGVENEGQRKSGRPSLEK
ncbi:hypothetical protein [Mesorhizobium captivum]|uniref:hypothetical protein n=1 Tax=Mesorhizobium captivum TaxID=3072319 RepID=UPI002A243065|nr:hypothetical protein [Mesorhizobium sp. VK22E]MDX8506134.1 hypothetical protein [Mesorhizobium sp. VK22E]